MTDPHFQNDVHMAHFFRQLENASVDQLCLFSKSTKVVASSADHTLLPFFQHMTQILVSGSDLEVMIKTHFMRNSAEWLLEQKVGKGADPSYAIDFMKEFSNLLAGKTKAMLESADFVVAQSLPFAIRGYNEIFYKVKSDQSGVKVWSLKVGEFEIHCSVTCSLKTARDISDFSKISYATQNPSDLGEVELF